MSLRKSSVAAGLFGVMLLALASHRPAALGQPRTVTATDPAPAAPDQVVIKREAIHLTPPDKYKVELVLEPIRQIDLAAPIDGVLETVRVKPGETVADQAEVAQLDRAEQQLLVARAQANLKAAQIELNQAKAKSDKDQTDLAQARYDVAKAELDLANLRLQRASVRAPFAGQIFGVHAVAGQYVRAGDHLATIADTSQLRVEVPVDRAQVKAGDAFELKIEDQAVQGTVETVLPLAERFAPLRELMNSVASAIVVIENPGNAHIAGQTVNVPLIPRHPVVEIPNAALGNGPDGQRKVQVVRDDTVRDVLVQTLGQVGTDHLFVSGPFAPDDELIVSLSQPLPDGTQVQSASSAASPAGRTNPRATSRTGNTRRPSDSEF